MKRFILLLCVVMVTLTSACYAENVPLKLLDESEEVKKLQEALIDIGYLQAGGNTGIYDRFTKIAIETLQQDYDLSVNGQASPEIILIVNLLRRIQNREQVSTPKPMVAPTPTQIPLPNVMGMIKDTAVAVLDRAGFVSNIIYEFCEAVPKGKTIRATRNNRNAQIIDLVISKGSKINIYKQATWYAWWLKGSEGDDYNFFDVYINNEEQILYVVLDCTFNSTYHYKWRGYGMASITDTFDKVVPVDVIYESEYIEKGKKQRVTLKIPLNDLNVERPTTISVKLAMYYGASYNKEDYLRMDYTFAW